jgi:molybdopterin synthase catalytic subunit
MSDHDTALQDALACVRVSPEDFDLGAEVAALRGHDPQVGAVVSFVGTVREWVQAGAGPAEQPAIMELEHYPGMTERSIAELIVEARRRFDVRGVKVIHRVGPLAVCDQIVLVVVSSGHRGDAFHCAEFLMDWLKTQAPFWKKESAAGQSRWVDARISDDQAAARWGGLHTPPNVVQA